jgi:hypothetical protein
MKLAKTYKNSFVYTFTLNTNNKQKSPKLYKNSINRVLPCQTQIKKVKIEAV